MRLVTERFALGEVLARKVLLSPSELATLRKTVEIAERLREYVPDDTAVDTDIAMIEHGCRDLLENKGLTLG